MTKVIVFTNQKGGIGKTSLSIAFTRGLALKGKKVLAVDVDPSGNFSANSRADRKEWGTTLELMLGQVEPEDTIQYIEHGEYFLIAAPEKRQLKSRGFIKLLNQNEAPELSLRKPLEKIKDKDAFDYIVIDTGPDIDDLSMNALFAADEIIVPTTSNKNSLDGIPDLLDAIMAAQEGGNHNLKIRGILVNRYTPRFVSDRKTEGIISAIAEGLEAPVFETYIRNSQEVENATDQRLDVISFSPNHNVSKDILQFVDEFLKGEQNAKR